LRSACSAAEDDEGSQNSQIVFVQRERSWSKTLERELRILRSFDRPSPPMSAGCECSESCGGFGGTYKDDTNA
jgi:hypothetical protein